MGDALSAVFYGTIGSVLAVAVIAIGARTRTGLAFFGTTYQLAWTMKKLGITRFHGSRDDYEGTLPTYLTRAVHSIGIVSISLKQTHDEGDLISLFRRRLAENSSFRISISLVAPKSDACRCAAMSLNLSHEQLAMEVMEMCGFRKCWPVFSGNSGRFVSGW